MRILSSILLSLVLTFHLVAQSETDLSNPDTWQVDPSQFSSTMIINGTLEIEGSLSTDENDIIGAFINGECRGVSRPEYLPAVDNYIVTIFVYANSTLDSVEFRFFDASAERLYPHFERLQFSPGLPIGRFSDPYEFKNKIFDVTFEATSPICAQDSAGGLRITSTKGLQPPLIYKWNTGDSTTRIDQLSQGQYILTVTDEEAFFHIDTFQLENRYDTIPQPFILNSGNINICAGEEAILMVLPPDSISAWDYRWLDNDGAVLGTGSVLETSPLNQDTIFNIQSFIRACSSDLLSIPVQISIPEADFLVQPDTNLMVGDTVRFTVNNPEEGFRYFWDFGNENFSSQTNPFHIYQGAGVFEVNLRVTDENGCSATLAYNKPLLIQVVTSTRDYSISSLELVVAPNPCNDYCYLQIQSNQLQEVLLQLSNSFGQILHRRSIELTPHQNYIELNEIELLPSGQYVISLVKEGRVLSTKKLFKN